MLNENEKKAVALFKKSLLAEFPECELRLFGSKARGDSDQESDIDIMVLLDRPITGKVKNTVYEKAFPIMIDHDIVFGLIIKSRSLYKELIGVSPFISNVEKEGIPI